MKYFMIILNDPLKSKGYHEYNLSDLAEGEFVSREIWS
jgi:hypothetical protein